MQRILPIILLGLLLALQFGRILSYIHCTVRKEITNITRPGCDCAKILTHERIKADNPAPITNNLEKTRFEDAILLPVITAPLPASSNLPVHTVSHTFPLQAGMANPIDHPPAA